MRFVIDASVIIAVIGEESEKKRLIELTTGADLLAPASVHWEIGNAFSAMIKRGKVTLEQALTAIGIYRQIPLRFVEVELADALQIAAEHGIYAYDAYLLQCAIKYKSKLITLDQKLSRIAREVNVEVEEVNQ